MISTKENRKTCWDPRVHPACPSNGNVLIHCRYHGENLLHIAIVNRNFEMCKWLIEREPKLLEGKATGSFFQRTGLFYFGEYPLGFAVCSNQAFIVELMLDAGANLIAQDSNGNTVFHLCVWWKRKEMYAFLEDQCKKRNLCPDEDPTKIQNTLEEACEHAAGEGLTCLNLAAFLGDLDMFEWMLKRKMVVQWAYGTVTSYLVPLEEIDWKRGKKMGSIEWVVDLAHRDFMQCRHINTLVDRKWHRFAAAAFELRFRRAIFFMVSFSFLTICDEGVYGSWLEMLFIAGLELSLVVGCCTKVMDEVQEIHVEGLRNYLSPRAMLENICSLVPCTSYLMLFVSHHTVQWRGLEHVLRLTTAALGWVYMMYFLLGMKRTGHFVVMIAKMLVRDLVPFSLFTSVFIGMFSTLFFILFEDTPTLPKFAKHLQIAFDGVIGNMNLDISDVYTSDGVPPSAIKLFMAKLILVAFVVMCIVLLNLLVAMMGDTYSMISEDAELEWMLQRASTIFSIEQNMSDEELCDEKIKYWVEIDGQKYLQIEEEIKGVFDEFQTAESMKAKLAADTLAARKKARQERREAADDAKQRGETKSGQEHVLDDPTSLEQVTSMLNAKMDTIHSDLADLVLQECAEIKASLTTESSRRGSNGPLMRSYGNNAAGTSEVHAHIHNLHQVEKTAELNAKVEFLTSQVTSLIEKNHDLQAHIQSSNGRGRFASIVRKASQNSLTRDTQSRALPSTPSQSSLLLTSPE